MNKTKNVKEATNNDLSFWVKFKKSLLMNKSSIFKDFEDLSKNKNFVRYTQVFGSALLESNQNHKVTFIKELPKKIEIGYKRKLDFVFKMFVISWVKNNRYSYVDLIPTIKSSENPNSDSLNFIDGNSNVSQNFFGTYNRIVNRLLETKKIVEILPGIAVYVSSETKTLKIAFSEDAIIKEETTKKPKNKKVESNEKTIEKVDAQTSANPNQKAN